LLTNSWFHADLLLIVKVLEFTNPPHIDLHSVMLLSTISNNIVQVFFDILLLLIIINTLLIRELWL
jgi:hypothetical protein